MEENSSKIVSIHSDVCSSGCPNSSVCYLQNRRLTNFVSSTDITMSAITNGYTVHEAVCDVYANSRLQLVRKYPNYNITVSSKLFDSSIGVELSFLPIDQVQVSCYDYRDLFRFKEHLKLFLIKDHDTFEMYKQIQNDLRLSKVHFTIDQQWLTKERLKELVDIHNTSPLHQITLDSCLSNWVVHGRCMYMKTYIDLSNDGTFRKCPFKVEGIPINNRTIEEMIQYTEPVTCKYHELFNEGVSQ